MVELASTARIARYLPSNSCVPFVLLDSCRCVQWLVNDGMHLMPAIRQPLNQDGNLVLETLLLKIYGLLVLPVLAQSCLQDY